MASKTVELKYLGFVRVLAMKMMILFSSVYEYAKQSAGSVKSRIVAVEDTIVSVFGPVYQKFKDVPEDFLSLADNKVHDALNKFEVQAPHLAKQFVGTTQSMVQSSQLVGTAQSLIQKAPDLANQLLTTTQSKVQDMPLVSAAQSMIQQGSEIGQDLFKEAQAAGPSKALKSAVTVFKLWALTELAKFWYAADKIALFHRLAQVALPIAAYFSVKYNKVVVYYAANGITVLGYLPLIPIDEIASMYKMVKATKEDSKGTSN